MTTTSLDAPVPVSRPRTGRSGRAPAWAAVVLLAICAFLLWRLVQTHQTAPTQGRATGPSMSLPPLHGPGASSGSAVLQQVRGMQRRIEKPLTGIGAELSTAVHRLAFTSTLPSLLNRLVHNTAGFSSVPRNLAQLTTSARDLAGVRQTLVGVLREVKGLSHAASSIDRMVAAVQSIGSSFGHATSEIGALLSTTQQTLPEMVSIMRAMAARMQQMGSDLATIRRCTERPVICNGG